MVKAAIRSSGLAARIVATSLLKSRARRLKAMSTRRTIGRTIEMIVRGSRSRRDSGLRRLASLLVDERVVDELFVGLLGPSTVSVMPGPLAGCRASAGPAWPPASPARTSREPLAVTSRAPGRAARSSAASSNGPVEDRVGDADLEDRVRVGHGDAGQPVRHARTRPPRRCRCRRTAARSTPRRSRAAASAAPARLPSPRGRRRRESGRMDGPARPARPARGSRPPPRAAAGRRGWASRCTARSGRRSLVRTSWPTITVSPSGAASRAARAASMRSWSVMARWVRPRCGRGPKHGLRPAERVERGAACGSAGRRTRGRRPTRRTPLRCAGPATSGRSRSARGPGRCRGRRS